MHVITQYLEFKSLDSFDKVNFLDEFLEANRFASFTVPQLKLFLQNIIVNEPNSYLKQRSIEIYSALVLNNTLKAQALVSLLIEDIEEQAEIFIHVIRLRLLFLHYDASAETDLVFERLSHHTNAEVASEALYRWGLLLFLALPINAQQVFTERLQKCRQCFSNAAIIVENRVDADYYATICELFLTMISNECGLSKELLGISLAKLWTLKAYSPSCLDFQLESRIGHSLSLLVDIADKLENQTVWLDYQKELSRIFELHQKLISIEVDSNLPESNKFGQLQRQISVTILSPLYQRNLLAASAKVQVLLNQEVDAEFFEFLDMLNTSLKQEPVKKKDRTELVALLARKFTHLEIADINRDVEYLQPNDDQALVSLVATYADSNSTNFITGHPQGDEVYKLMYNQIIGLMPDYPKAKLNSFTIVLSSVISYVVRTMQDKKEFFPELYDSTYAVGRTEHIFQESIYRNLRQSVAGYRYLYEPNQAGGGRIDITYNDDGLVYPIEIKKTASAPTWDDVKSYYLAQAQTYANAYDQLGIFMVFELSIKTADNSPINDIRELFKFQSLKSHLKLDGNFPNGVVCIVVPANKVSPSTMSTYR